MHLIATSSLIGRRYTGWKEIHVMISIGCDMNMFENIAKCIVAFEYLGNEVLYHVPLASLEAHGRPSQHVLDVAPLSQDAEVCVPRYISNDFSALL